MKEYKKMFIVNGINLSEKEFDSVINSFCEFNYFPDRINLENGLIETNSSTQVIDKFSVDITTYYFNYFGKFIEIGQQIISKQL